MMNYRPSLQPKYKQAGLGMVEVLVSLLLLAVSILGFVSLQMRAVGFTQESVMRSEGVNVMRNLSEEIRLNPDKLTTYETKIKGVWDGLEDSKQTLEGYCGGVDTFIVDEQIADNDCSDDNCDIDAQIIYNVAQYMTAICNAEMMLNMQPCPGTENTVNGRSGKSCVIVSWDQTLPIMSADDNSCANEEGIYNRGSSCMIVEAY